jgi:hypothetical protein
VAAIGLGRCRRDLWTRGAAALDDGEHAAVCLRHRAILSAIRQSDHVLEVSLRRGSMQAAPEFRQISNDAFVQTHENLLLASAAALHECQFSSATQTLAV